MSAPALVPVRIGWPEAAPVVVPSRFNPDAARVARDFVPLVVVVSGEWEAGESRGSVEGDEIHRLHELLIA